MLSRKMESKFKGCLIGGHVGDCLGGPFEDEVVIAPEKVKKFFDHLLTSTREGQYNYTDDTAMAWNMLDSLLEKNMFDPKDMSTRFSDTYFKESFRYYGGHIVAIFAAWKRAGLVDVYQPAQLQFEGSGSFGNGGPMKVAPIALYFYNNPVEMVKLAILTTRLTHAHPLGIVGTLMQCWAVRLALDEDPTSDLNAETFIDNLKLKLEQYKSEYGKAVKHYASQLDRIKVFLKREHVIIGNIVDEFGNNETAPKSVATALYCFFRGTRKVAFISTENNFERTIQLAISMGGDTDTIACMAGSIAGSYYGIDGISAHLIKCCEKIDKSYDYAQKLYAISTN